METIKLKNQNGKPFYDKLIIKISMSFTQAQILSPSLVERDLGRDFRVNKYLK
jgi:hypothetical protein